MSNKLRFDDSFCRLVTSLREIRILKALKHENIVEMREIVTYNAQQQQDAEAAQATKDLSHGGKGKI